MTDQADGEPIDFFGTADEVRTRITSPLLHDVLDIYLALPATNGLPTRASFQPMSIARALHSTFMVDVLPDDEFRYRLVGSMIEDKYQRGSMKGQSPREIMGEGAEMVLRPYRRLRDTHCLFYREASLNWFHQSRSFVRYKILLMPFSEDGEQVSMIMGVHDFIEEED